MTDIAPCSNPAYFDFDAEIEAHAILLSDQTLANVYYRAITLLMVRDAPSWSDGAVWQYSIPGSRKRPTLLGYLCLGLNEPIVSTLPKLDFQLHFLSPKTRASHFHMEAHDKVLVRLSDYSEVFVRNASRYHAAAGLAAIAVGAEKTIYLCKAQDYLRILVLELQKETVETFVLSHSGHSAPQGSWKIVFPIKSRSKNTSPNGVNFAALINRVVQRLLNIR